MAHRDHKLQYEEETRVVQTEVERQEPNFAETLPIFMNIDENMLQISSA